MLQSVDSRQQLEMSDFLLGPLFDGLCPLLGGWHGDQRIQRSQRVKTDRPVDIEDRAISSVQCLPKVGDTCDVLGAACQESGRNQEAFR